MHGTKRDLLHLCSSLDTADTAAAVEYVLDVAVKLVVVDVVIDVVVDVVVDAVDLMSEHWVA